MKEDGRWKKEEVLQTSYIKHQQESPARDGEAFLL
jgi:hypothetical protein